MFNMAVTLDEPTVLDNILYYGLIAGAIFQVICICAVVFIPQYEYEKEVDAKPLSVATPFSMHSASAKRPKKEKKKHR